MWFAWVRVALQPDERLLFVVVLALHSMNFAMGWSGSGHAEVWNPVVGVMPFTALLVVCVGVVAGAPGLLPLAWFAHAFVTQAHVEYALPATAALFLAVVSFARESAVEHRARTSSVCAVVFLGSWFPTLRDAVGNQGGNLRQLVAFFLHPWSLPSRTGGASLSAACCLRPARPIATGRHSRGFSLSQALP